MEMVSGDIHAVVLLIVMTMALSYALLPVAFAWNALSTKLPDYYSDLFEASALPFITNLVPAAGVAFYAYVNGFTPRTTFLALTAIVITVITCIWAHKNASAHTK